MTIKIEVFKTFENVFCSTFSCVCGLPSSLMNSNDRELVLERFKKSKVDITSKRKMECDISTEPM